MILRYCVCIPTYNNPTTIKMVIADCLAQTPYPILVVDDGSLAPVFFEHERVRILRLASNQGKGAALRAGFKECLRQGFTHLISIDGDGQHLAREIPKLTALALPHPWDLIIGSRQLVSGNVPSISKFGRSFSNFWVRFQSSCEVSDSQSGLRIYPLFQVQTLRFWTHKFDFEIEVLIRLLWRGVAVREVEIECYYPLPADRVSHFHKFWDNLRISLLNTVLVIVSLLRSHRSPRAVAVAVGLGVFVGTTPLYGFHTLIAGGLAFAFRLNAAYLLVGTQISIPPLAPFLALASLAVGRKITGTSADTASRFSANWILGSLILGTGLAIVIGGITYLAIQKFNAQSSGEVKPATWNGRTRGGKWGNGCLKFVTRYAGLKTAYAFLIFVVPYFYFFAPKARHASQEYWRIVRPAEGRLLRQWRVLGHFYRFAQTLLDRVYQGYRSEPCFQARSHGMENILAPLHEGQGLILMTAHVGSWDLAAAGLKEAGLLKPFHMMQYESRGMSFDKARNQADPAHVKKLITNQIQQPLLHVRELLAKNLPVALMGDRPLGSQFELISFFGRLAPIDGTPFRVAAACQVPLLFTFGFKGQGDHYDFYATPAKIYRYATGPAKPLEILASAQEFAHALEDILQKYPDQWFNFFPIWSSLPTPPEGVATATARNYSAEELRTLPSSAPGWAADAKPSVGIGFRA